MEVGCVLLGKEDVPLEVCCSEPGHKLATAKACFSKQGGDA